MLRGIFSRRIAYFGIATMVGALVAGISWFVPALGPSVLLTLLPFGVWGVMVGRQLYSIGLGAAQGLNAAVSASRGAGRGMPSSPAPI
jgi:hypothetical protein